MAQLTACSSSFAAADQAVIEGLTLSYLKAPLLRWGSSTAQGNGEHGQRCVFLVGPDALIGPFPGGPVCRPYEMRESSSLAVGADDLGGPRAHTVLPYVGKRAGSVGSEAAGAGIKPHQSQFSSRSGPQWGRTEWHPSTPGIARRKDRTTSKG